MARLVLPAELVSLVQHVELNKAGWWDKTVQRLIVAVIWASDKRLTTQGVVHELRKMLGVDLRLGQVKAQVKSLCELSMLIRLPDGQLKIPEEQLEEFTKQLERVKHIQEAVKGKFIRLFQQHCPVVTDPELVWNSFNDGLLVPLVSELGARTYELIAGIRLDLEAIPRISCTV